MRRFLFWTSFALCLLAVTNVFGQGATIYTGKRLHYSSVKVLSENKKYIKLSVVVSNTGREPIRLFADLSPGKVYFTFGHSFDNSKVQPIKWHIVKKSFDRNTTLQPGELLTLSSLKIRKSDVAKLGSNPFDTSREISGKKKNPQPQKDEKPQSVDVESSSVIAGAQQAKEVENNKTTSSVPTSTQTEGHTSMPAAQDLPKPSSEKKQTHSKTKIMSPIGVAPRPEKSNKCVDLTLENLVIEKTTKRNAYVSFDLVNYGEGVFHFSRKDKSQESLGVKAYLASVPRLTRGALIAGGKFFDDLFDAKEFELYSGGRIRGEMKVPLELMTKFTPVIILELDPFSSLDECSKTNNVNTVLYKKKQK